MWYRFAAKVPVNDFSFWIGLQQSLYGLFAKWRETDSSPETLLFTTRICATKYSIWQSGGRISIGMGAVAKLDGDLCRRMGNVGVNSRAGPRWAGEGPLAR
jgi:hypothetical protein